MIGFNNFPNVSVLSCDLSKSNPTAIVIDIFVDLFNPAKIAVTPMGILTLDVFYNNVKMGTLVTTEEVNLFSGKNEMSMIGKFLER